MASWDGKKAPIAYRAQLETAPVQTQGRLQATVYTIVYTIVDDQGREAYDKQKNSTENYIRIGRRGRAAV